MQLSRYKEMHYEVEDLVSLPVAMMLYEIDNPEEDGIRFLIKCPNCKTPWVDTDLDVPHCSGCGFPSGSLI